MGSVFLRPIICGAICALSAYGSYMLFDMFIGSAKLVTLIAIFVAIFVYVVVVFIFGAVTRDDIMLLPKGSSICRVLEKIKLLRA